MKTFFALDAAPQTNVVYFIPRAQRQAIMDLVDGPQLPCILPPWCRPHQEVRKASNVIQLKLIV